MIISAIKHKGFLYFNLHAEEVVSSNFIAEDNVGMLENRLQIVTLNRVVEYLKTSENLEVKNIVLDFKGINACQPNLHVILIELKGAGYNIQLKNIKKNIVDDSGLSVIQNNKNVLEGELFKKFFLFESEHELFTDEVINTHQLFTDAFKEKIKQYINPHTQPHTSSYVYLTSYVDIKKFISYEKEFMLFSIYKLALKIQEEWAEKLANNPILVCQSMNSAYIVSVLSNLLKLDILILDKIGPIYKIYNTLDKTIDENREYIVVSDLVCLGTEVKIVKSLIQFIGGKYLGNVSIIKTETLSKSDILRQDATIAVFSINKSNNRELGYNIKTDLEQF
jgi:hypothetical protein